MLFFFARRFRPSCLAGVIALTAGLVLAGPATQAQGTTHRHLIEFRDKTGTPYTVGQPLQYLSPRAVSRRQRQQIAVLPRDLPPTPAYVQQVRAVAGVTVIYRTRWLNGLVIECDTNRLTQVLALPFVRSGRTLNRAVAGGRTHPVRRVDEQRPSSPNPYGIAFAQAEQIGATTMHAAGFRGEGMHIAVLDAGFPGVNVIPAFQPLFQQNRLLSTFDVVRGGTNVYDIDSHGTWVLSTMAAYQPNAFIGTAPNASYHLIRTEDNRGTESPVEEAYWLIGAEYADSVGVDIINSSLGYRDFDNPDFSYSYSQMDGNTALSTRAADLASAVGILVVNSAGNSGNNASWPYVSAPADGDSVLSVGAVDSLGVRIGFSSIGPTADGQIKPNLATQGSQTAIIDPSGFIGRGSGTSFASPVLAGMAAGFWQANPTLTAQQVRQYLELSGSQASAPDNLLGYGIPDFRRAYNLANPNNPLGLPVGEGRSVPELYPNPVPGAAFALRLPARLINQLLTVRITDAAGRTVSEQQLKTPSGSDSVTITAGENVLKSGLYLCQVRAASGEQHTLRFVRN